MTRKSLEFTAEAAIVTAVATLGLGVLGYFQLRANNEQFQLQYDHDKETMRKNEEVRMDRNRKAIRPYLAVAHSASFPEIDIFNYRRDSTDDVAYSRIELVFPDRRNPSPDEEHLGFVVEITNLGDGSALNCRVDWELEGGIYRDGREMLPSDLFASLYEDGYTRPKVIRPGATARIRALPGRVVEDTQLQIASVWGYLKMSCKDVAGDPHDFRQTFVMSTYYDPFGPGFGRGLFVDCFSCEVPALEFRFDENRDHSYPDRLVRESPRLIKLEEGDSNFFPEIDPGKSSDFPKTEFIDPNPEDLTDSSILTPERRPARALGWISASR